MSLSDAPTSDTTHIGEKTIGVLHWFSDNPSWLPLLQSFAFAFVRGSHLHLYIYFHNCVPHADVESFGQAKNILGEDGLSNG